MTKEYVQLTLPTPPEKTIPYVSRSHSGKQETHKILEEKKPATHMIFHSKHIVPLVNNYEGNAWQVRHDFPARLVRMKGKTDIGIFMPTEDVSLYRDGREMLLLAELMSFEAHLRNTRPLEEEKE